MANKIIEARAATGETSVTISAYLIGSDTVASQADGLAATEASNRSGMYTCTAADLPAGDYYVQVLSSASALLADWFCTVSGKAGTFGCYETDPTILKVLSWNNTVLAGQISNAGNTAEQYDQTIDSNEYRLVFSGLTADGDRSGVTQSRPT